MAENLLQGVIDMHVHCSPDAAPRKTDDIELAKAAADAGMGGFLIKSHSGSSVERAYLIRQMFPGLHVYGGLVLNHAVGGLNPNTVDIYVQMGARQIWMPTFSAQAMFDFRNVQKAEGEESFPLGNVADSAAAGAGKWKGANWPWDKNGRGISILGEDGKLVEEVWQILEIMAAGNAILGTGHISIPETLALIDAALEMKVERLLITHPEYMSRMSIEDQVSLAKRGVFFERCYICASKLAKLLGQDVSFEAVAENIRAVGVEANILATDFGQPQNDHPVDGMREFLEKLSAAGFTDSDIETMGVKTSKHLLGLK